MHEKVANPAGGLRDREGGGEALAAPAGRGASPGASPPEDVVITMYVGPHGRVESVGFASPTTMLEDDWAACAEKAALGWHLPDPKGQVTKLAVRYRPR